MPLIDKFSHGRMIVAANKRLFGDGSDGDLIITAGQTVTLSVATPNKDIVEKQYKTIRIEAGGILTTSAPNCGLFLRCQGDCVIAGTVNQNGKAGIAYYENTYEYPNVLGGNGGNGGNGGQGGSSYHRTNLPGGKGSEGMMARPYGGGLGGTAGGGAGGQTYSSLNGMKDARLATRGGDAPVVTGSSVSHGAPGIGGIIQSETSPSVLNGGGDGGYCTGIPYGGGAVFLYVAGAVTISGSILCAGSKGNDGTAGQGNYYNGNVSRGFSDAGGGGGGAAGGGGGVVYVCHAGEYTMTGTFNVSGGNGGTGGAKGTCTNENGTISSGWGAAAGTSGSSGAIGQIKIVKYEKGMTV